MADATVRTPEQVQQMLAAQSQHASTSSQPTQASSSASTSSPNRLKTSYTKSRSLEAFYTGGATAFTPDGRLLFSTLNENVAVVQVNSGNVIHTIEGDTEEVTAIAVSPSGSHLVIASRSLALRIYSIPDLKLIRSIPKSHLSQVNLMAIDPTSTLLATGGSDGVAKVWDLEGGYCTHTFKGHAGVVSALAWNMPSAPAASSSLASPKKGGKAKPSRRTIELLTGSVDGKVRIWDLNKPEEVNKAKHVLVGHDSVVRGISVTEDGNTFVSGSRDRTIVIWKLIASKSGVSWKQSDTLSAEEGIESVGFLPVGSRIGSVGGDGKQQVFWTGGSEGELRLWDVATGSIIAREPRTYNELVAKQAKEDAKQKALAAGRHLQDILDAEDDEETRAITAVHLVRSLASSGSTTLDCLASVHADQNIVLRSLESKSPLSKTRQLIGFNDEIVDITLTSTSQAPGVESHLAVATNSRSIRIYDLPPSTLEGNAGSSIGQDSTSADLLTGHTDIVLCLDRSPDMRLLASGAKDRSARIWAWMPSSRLQKPTGTHGSSDADTGKKLSRGKPMDSGVSADDNEVVGEWICVGICEGHAESVGAVAFARRSSSPGAAGAPFIVTASQDRTVKIWDLSPVNALLTSSSSRISSPITLKSLVTQRIHEKDINCLDVSPNNAMIASGSQDKTCKLYSLAFTPGSKGKPASARLSNLATLKGHKRGVWACKFSPVDLAIATASGDKSIRLWSLKDFSCVKMFEGHTNSVLKLSFLSLGMQLLSCAGDGLIKLWNIKDEECVTTLDAHEEKVWSLVVSQNEKYLWSSAADSTITLWEDRSQQDQQEKEKEMQELIQKEQDFGNYLTVRDWKNAISLALAMGQPRRLLNLFTHVANSRPDTGASNGANQGLLGSILSANGKSFSDDGESGSDDDDDEIMLDSFDDGKISTRAKAGISNSSRRKPNQSVARAAATSNGISSGGVDDDASSITGLSAVDSVLTNLSPSQLVQLLSYVRDWNTSTRTSSVAQTVLHAILRSYSASHLIKIFETQAAAHRSRLAQREEDEENGVVKPLTPKQLAREKRRNREQTVDLTNLIDAIIPYTERHFQRADRTLIESNLLQYTVEAMNTLVGMDLEQDQDEAQEANATFAERLGEQDNEDSDGSDEDEDAMSETSD